MRVALGQLQAVGPSHAALARQLGIQSLQLNTPSALDRRRQESGEDSIGEHSVGGFDADLDRYHAHDAIALVRDAKDTHGLSLEIIENVPPRFLFGVWDFNDETADAAAIALRNDRVAAFCDTVRALGAAGIRVLGFHWMPLGVWRTSVDNSGRGGAVVTAFDAGDVGTEGKRCFVARREDYAGADSGALWQPVEETEAQAVDERLSEEQMWTNYEFFLKTVLPVAAEAGVRLAQHPDDPPVPQLGGVARIFRSVDAFKRAEAIAASTPGGEAWGLELCLGTISEMEGGAADVAAMIDHFGPRDRIVYVHFRDVKGSVPSFEECFIGEGNYDPAKVLLQLQAVGFDGILLDDHVPHMDNDTDWDHMGRAHAIGYIQGLLRALDLGDSPAAKITSSVALGTAREVAETPTTRELAEATVAARSMMSEAARSWHTARVKCLVFHSTEPWLLAGTFDGAVTIYDTNTFEVLGSTVDEVDGDEAVPIRACCFIERMGMLICGTDHCALVGYDGLPGALTVSGTIENAHDDYIRTVVCHPTRSLVLSGSDDMTIRGFDWEDDWRQVFEIRQHTHYVMSIALSPNNPDMIVSVGLDNAIGIWDLKKMKEVQVLGGAHENEKGINSAKFTSGPEPVLLTGGDDRLVRVTNWKSGVELADQTFQMLSGHSNNVCAVAYHSQRGFILSGGEDGTLRIWDSSTFELVDVFASGDFGRIWAIDVDPNTGAIAVGTDEGCIVMQLDAGTLTKSAQKT
jgi:mannonate dehydratase